MLIFLAHIAIACLFVLPYEMGPLVPSHMGEQTDRRRLGAGMWGKKLDLCLDFLIKFQIVNQCFLSK